MRFRPEHAQALLPQVDPGHLRFGWAVGLRDGALLALVAAGLSAVEIAALRASAVTMHGGRVVVSVRRHGVTWSAALPADLGSRLLVWLSECRLWADAVPVFRGARGPLTADGVRKVLNRYRRARQARTRRRSQ
jgi:hypothetical protein